MSILINVWFLVSMLGLFLWIFSLVWDVFRGRKPRIRWQGIVKILFAPIWIPYALITFMGTPGYSNSIKEISHDITTTEAD